MLKADSSFALGSNPRGSRELGRPHPFAIRRFRPRPLAAALTLPLLALMMALASGCRGKGQAAAPTMPLLPVQVAQAMQQDVPVYGDWVATLDGYVNAQIQPQVSGYLVKQNYHEGSVVRAGEVLFEIDRRPFQAVLDQAKGQLAQARAQLFLANTNLKRDTPLVKEHVIAQSQLDTETAAQLQAQAAVETAEAAVEQAQLNLNFTEVRSLIDGVAGIATTQMGNLVSPSTVLTTVSKLNPIKVYFPISEKEYLKFSGGVREGTARSPLHNSSGMPLDLILSDGSTYAHKGHVIFTDRQIDPQTGTLRLIGEFPNPGNLLRPGQFGRIRALLGVRQGAVLVPQRCVAELQGTYQVAVVGGDNKVSIRKVKVGDRSRTMWVIEDGVKAGESVVTEGVSKVQDGMAVSPTADTATGKEN